MDEPGLEGKYNLTLCVRLSSYIRECINDFDLDDDKPFLMAFSFLNVFDFLNSYFSYFSQSGRTYSYPKFNFNIKLGRKISNKKKIIEFFSILKCSTIFGVLIVACHLLMQKNM